MKVYMHCEEFEFTTVVVWPGTGTVNDILEIFCKNLNEKYPAAHASVNHGEVFKHSKTKRIDVSQQVSVAVTHMEDLYVKFPNLTVGVDSKDKDSSKTEKVVEQKKTAVEKSPPQNVILNKAVEGMRNQAVLCVGNQKLREAIQMYKDIGRLSKNNRHALLGLCECYKKAGRPEKALAYAQKGLKVYPDDGEFLLAVGECYILNGDGDRAQEDLMKYCKLMRAAGGLKTDQKHDVNVLLAKAYLLKGQKDMAITILQGVLRENKDHHDALAEYAVLIFPLGSVYTEDSITILLALVSSYRTDKNIKQKFTNICCQPDGLRKIEKNAPKAWNDVTTLTFLATVLRECGAVKEAVQMLKHAHKIEPRQTHVILTLMHMLELSGSYTEAVQLVKEYVTKYPNTIVKGVTCGLLVAFLENVGEDVTVTDQEVDDLHLTPAQMEFDQRYLIAALFTVVKILYITGRLENLSALAVLMEPGYKLGRELHKTDIRNEAAYYISIHDVLQAWDGMPGPSPLLQGNTTLDDKKMVYFLGDSHCIPAAWQTITLKDEEHMIKPVLSTGTKVWHLRDESKFYPKVNFESCVKQIPDEAKVIVCFGEIDCREALPICWEKARYETIEDAIDAVIRIYMKLLKKLQKDHKWTIFIQPVPPVLDQTRPLVLEFNNRLGARLGREKTLHWLDITSDLLTPDGMLLKEEYKLDGTHVHPRYVQLLEERMNQRV